MKKKLKIIISILMLCVLGFLVYNVITKMQYKNDVEKHLQTIPKFGFKTLENNDFTNADLDSQTATVFIYFNTECNFCQHEAQSISDNLDRFKNVQFIFTSRENIDTIKQFSEQYNLNNKPNITFLYDNLSTFSSQFDANSIPYILIYNKNQKLIKKNKGQLNAKGILRALNQND